MDATDFKTKSLITIIKMQEELIRSLHPQTALSDTNRELLDAIQELKKDTGLSY